MSREDCAGLLSKEQSQQHPIVASSSIDHSSILMGSKTSCRQKPITQTGEAVLVDSGLTWISAKIDDLLCSPSLLCCSLDRLFFTMVASLGTRTLLLASFFVSSTSFQPRIFPSQRTHLQLSEEVLDCSVADENDSADRLKRELFQLGASYDRGFGASPRGREKAASVIEQLEKLNTEENANRGIEGPPDGIDISPLSGSWRMVWTTAVDVLLLQASPIFTTGAIYQVFEPPIVTNVIDFFPRIQSLLPPDVVPNSLLRASVKTRANERAGTPNRVGLVFEAVEVVPLQVLGMDLDIFPPLGFNLPKLPGLDQSTDSPGFFDVTYLDEEVLVIRQNAPGGLFALVKVDSIEA